MQHLSLELGLPPQCSGQALSGRAKPPFPSSCGKAAGQWILCVARFTRIAFSTHGVRLSQTSPFCAAPRCTQTPTSALWRSASSGQSCHPPPLPEQAHSITHRKAAQKRQIQSLWPQVMTCQHRLHSFSPRLQFDTIVNPASRLKEEKEKKKMQLHTQGGHKQSTSSNLLRNCTVP